MTAEKDPFDLWWEWATKDRATDFRTISSDIHNAVMALPPDERRDRAKVNAAAQEGLRLSELRPAGSADEHVCRKRPNKRKKTGEPGFPSPPAWR